MMISFSFFDGLEGLDHVCAHCDLRDIDVAVGHRDLGQGLGLYLLACCRKLRYLTDVGGLGGLAAGIGVDLGVEYEDVYILAGGENMVNAAEADIEGPAVTAEDPAALLVEVVLLCEYASEHAGQSQCTAPSAFACFMCSSIPSALSPNICLA